METASEAKQVGKGEPEVGAAVREHAPALARVCMALVGNASGAESALASMARDAGAKRPPEGVALRVWLMGLARASAAAHLSRMPLRAQRDEDAASQAVGRGSSEAAVARQSLGRLKPSEREAVVLHVVGGLDVEDVAVACGVEPSVARERVARGVIQLLSASHGSEGEG